VRIFVPDAHAMGSIACIRSLGRAGHTVVAAAQHADALGLRSRFCSHAVLQPPGLTGDGYRRWLDALVREHRIELMVPSEAMATALGASIVDYAPMLAGGPDPTRMVRFMSKFELFRLFHEASDAALREHLPATVLLEREVPFPSLAALRTPLFAKFDGDPAADLPARVVRFDTHEAAQRDLPALVDRYGRGIVQQFSPGVGVGVFFLRWNGEIKATLMHRRLHEVPHTGGMSSFRETWWDDALHADALRRIEALDWWGVGMLEYRWVPETGAFELMEFNARFWGSLHLALFADVDFPRLLVDAWSGKPFAPVRARPGVRCRYTFPKDVEHLWSLLRDKDVPASRKLGAAAEFITLSFDPGVHSDLWFEGDRGLYWRALRDTPKKFLG
jgi:hypothetical protein